MTFLNVPSCYPSYKNVACAMRYWNYKKKSQKASLAYRSCKGQMFSLFLSFSFINIISFFFVIKSIPDLTTLQSSLYNFTTKQDPRPTTEICLCRGSKSLLWLFHYHVTNVFCIGHVDQRTLGLISAHMYTACLCCYIFF